MKKFLSTIIVSLVLGSMLVPTMVIAAADPTQNLCKSKINDSPEANPCLTDDEKSSKVYTILEESLDTPDTVANDGNSTARKCFRYTEILRCIPDGATSRKQKINQELLQPDSEGGCPIVGIPNTGTDENGQYFDCQEVTVLVVNPESGGTGILTTYVSLIYRWAAGIVGIIAVLIIIVSGIQISTADGEPSKVDEAKTRIIQSLGGIALLFLASALLYVINPTFFKPPSYTPQTEDQNKEAFCKNAYKMSCAEYEKANATPTKMPDEQPVQKSGLQYLESNDPMAAPY